MGIPDSATRRGLSRLVAGVLVLIAAAATQQASTFQVPPLSIRFAAAPDVLAGVDVVRWRGTTAAPVPAEISRDGSETVVAIHGCQARDVYVVRAAHVVSDPVQPRTDAECSASTSAKLYPSGRLRGQVSAPDGLPSRLWMSVSQCRAPGQTRLGVYPVTVGQQGLWDTLVPAGCLNLVFAEAGYASVERRNVEVAAGRAAALAAFALRRLATLEVLARDSRDRAAIRNAALWVLDESVDRALSEFLSGKMPAHPPAGRTDEGGSARVVVDLPYPRLCARASGWAPSCTAPIDATAPRRDPLEILLSAPGALRVSVQRLTSDPGAGQPISFSAVAIPKIGDDWVPAGAVYARPDADGIAQFLSLPAGSWRVRATVDLPSIGSSHLPDQDVVVEAGGTADVVFDLSQFLVRGRVTAGTRPVRGRLLFSAVAADGTMMTASATTDQDGQFAVLLSWPGRYLVRVTGEDRSVLGIVPNLDVDAPRIDIRLAGADLRGTVVTDTGTPAPDAVVHLLATSLDEVAFDQRPIIAEDRRTDPSGAFAFRSLPPGEWNIQASKGLLASTPTALTLGREGSREATLVLRPSWQVTGRVAGAGGEGLAGVQGRGFIEPLGDAETAQPIQFVTDADGYFTVSARTPVPGVLNVQLDVPTVGLTARRCPTGRPCELRVDPVSGPLTLTFAPSALPPLPGRTIALVSEEGALAVPLMTQGFRGAVVDGRVILHLPRVSAGNWEVVAVSALDPIGRIVAGLPSGRYTLGRVTVAPVSGGRLVIDR